MPNYSKYGRSAPIKRNYEMVDMSDAVLVVWDGESKGTESTVKYANKIGKQIILIQN